MVSLVVKVKEPIDIKEPGHFDGYSLVSQTHLVIQTKSDSKASYMYIEGTLSYFLTILNLSHIQIGLHKSCLNLITV